MERVSGGARERVEAVGGSTSPNAPGTLPLRLAHRGDHRHAPENSLAAFRAALAVPACDGLEFDVRLSGDGVPVVVHDATLSRVRGRPDRVDGCSAADLGALGIPTLAEVLAIAPAEAFLDVELKHDTADATLDVLRAGRTPDLGGTVVSSFDVAALETVRALAPSWPCWLNALALDETALELALWLGCRGIAADWQTIDERMARRVHERGLELAAWTVVRPATFARLARMGVGVICVEGPALDG